MTDNAWNSYARERYEADIEADRYRRRVGGYLYDEADLPDADEVER